MAEYQGQQRDRLFDRRFFGQQPGNPDQNIQSNSFSLNIDRYLQGLTEICSRLLKISPGQGYFAQITKRLSHAPTITKLLPQSQAFQQTLLSLTILALQAGQVTQIIERAGYSPAITGFSGQSQAFTATLSRFLVLLIANCCAMPSDP
jgi:hypothetical protein